MTHMVETFFLPALAWPHLEHIPGHGSSGAMQLLVSGQGRAVRTVQNHSLEESELLAEREGAQRRDYHFQSFKGICRR